MTEKQNYLVAGIMSGTSLDGLDIAFCRFIVDSDKWEYQILDASTIPYHSEWKNKLSDASKVSGMELIQLHKDFGCFIGNQINEFIRKTNFKPDIIASHGHTVFHQPENKLTLQIGAGEVIAAQTGITTVFDFRSLDVALGGQGAPLVPVGDEILFGDYQYCLNLGGFANISWKKDEKRLASDICPVNIVLNKFAEIYFEGRYFYDSEGKLAALGEIDNTLLEKLNQLAFYNISGPKSLGREWVENEIEHLLESSNLSIVNRMRTFCEHIAVQIGKMTPERKQTKMLVTGGGAFNSFLMSRIEEHCHPLEIIIPDPMLVNYKEALVFALLGVLRIRNEINCLASVTGAEKDCCGGVVVKI